MKKLVLVFGLMIGASLAQAGVLYWQLTETPKVDDQAISFDYSVAIYAQVGESTDKVYLSNYVAGAPSGGTVGKIDTSVDGFPGSVLLLGADLGKLTTVDDYSTTTFVMEIYNPQGQALYKAELAGSDAISNSYISTAEFTSSWNMMNAWKPSTFVAVPEPTSGMMLLMGMALLALRRRKAA